MNTYRRFTCVCRSIRFFLDQDSEDLRELIVYNTDVEYPIIGSPDLPDNVKIINNNIDLKTGLPYNNIGAIRRDSLNYASGRYYICWDDDDIFLPWHISQCLDGFRRNPDIWAWKPMMSMFWRTGCPPEIAGNSMEASILVSVEALRSAGFNQHQGGGEHLGWMQKFNDERKLFVDPASVPSYCFNWADQGVMRGHKQSGTINRPDNFEYHRENTKDYALSPLSINYDVQDIYAIHIKALQKEIDKVQDNGYSLKREIYNKYALRYE